MSQNEFEDDDSYDEVLEKAKRKRQPDRFYNQDVAFGIMSLTLGLLVLFRTDVLLINAVAVRDYYRSAGLLGLVLFGVTLLAILWWSLGNRDDWGLDTMLIALLNLFVGCIVVLGVLLYFDLLALKIVEVVSPWWFLPSFGTVLICWWWTRKRTFTLDPIGVKFITILVMGFAAFYLTGLWSLTQPPGGLIDDLAFNGQRYYVIYEWQGVSADSGLPIDPRLSLHECNQHGWFCKELWAVNHDRYYRDVSLNFDSEIGTLSIVSREEPLYTYTP